MNIAELETFIAVCDHRSFSLAASQLHLTQPAVSKRVQALETRFGTALFDRIGKRIYLTEAGEVLLPKATQMLTLLQDTEHALHSLADQVSGRLSLATSHHIGLHRLAPVLRAFSQAYPEVQLDIQFEDSEVAHDLVRRADIELAVVTLNPQGDSELLSTTLWHDPLNFVSAQPSDKRLSLKQLTHQPCILPGTGTYTGRIVLERFHQAGLALSPSLSTNYLETIGMLVSVGLGWSVLPDSISQAQPDLHRLDVHCKAMARTLGYVVHPGRVMSNAARAFCQVLSDYADPT